jgi:hypothetical protein
MFTHEFTHAGSVTRVTIHRDSAGWELRQEGDSGVIQKVHCGDWHRVERALRSMGLGDRITTQKEASSRD